MKRTLSVLLLLGMLCALSTKETPAPTDTEMPGEEPVEEPSEEPAGSETPTAEDSSSVLIAYFSWSGNTEQVAQIIQQETGGDLFEITPATPYTVDYNELLDIAQQEQSDNARPELAGQVENWEQYDTIFIGYPIWWGDAPKIISTFLETYDFDGKTIVPFCTSGSSSIGSSADDLDALTQGAAWLEGQRFSGSASQETVSQWVDSLGLDLGQAA